MNPLTLTILLQLVAILLIMAEVIIPSGGVLAVMAVSILGYSLYLAFSDISLSAGMIFIVLDITLFPVLVLVGLRLLAGSPAALGKKLTRAEGVVAQAAELDKFLGRSGIVVAPLHPGGVAVIDGRRLDVVSRGEYIEKEKQVLVIAVTGNQIIVRALDDSEAGGAG
jgi:membrane-bound ClpP family serine protease